MKRFFKKAESGIKGIYKLMNIQISNWVGRLGNNIRQVKNAIQLGLYYKINIILPRHKYFNKTYIIINNKINKNNGIRIKHHFFGFKDIKNINEEAFALNIEEMRTILKDLFKLKVSDKLGTNDLVIHIRSGDIFSKRPHQGYVMPPLSYYCNILNNNKFDKIYLISEDKKNPVINKLLDEYKHIIYDSANSLDKDISLLLSSENVISSYGTFVPSLLLLSDNIKNVYIPNYAEGGKLCFLSLLNNVTIYETELTEYRKKMGDWKNTKLQRNIMLTF